VSGFLGFEFCLSVDRKAHFTFSYNQLLQTPLCDRLWRQSMFSVLVFAKLHVLRSHFQFPGLLENYCSLSIGH
jgi:hypothetical protein